uniref:F-box only protein n=1 Tax=Esox lucius TaxID=8010 RepID=A0A3P9AIU1_ESOLU
MAQTGGSWEVELQGQFSGISATSFEVKQSGQLGYTHGSSHTGLIDLSDEVFILILRRLDPTSLLRLGRTCRTLFRVCSCNSLWTRHFQTSFGVRFATASCSMSAKSAFRLIFMWRTLFRNLHCNRSLQEELFAEVPLPPHKYWIQWLVLEETVPLPSVELPCADIERLWGIEKAVLNCQVQDKVDEEGTVLKFEWKKLYSLALESHGSIAKVFHHVLNRQQSNDHCELEAMFGQYTQYRFQWLFTYWLFRQPVPFDRQLRAIYLQWQNPCAQKVAGWGGTSCDVRYLASLHHITTDFWRGMLARGDETVGIQTLENYFSMCKSLLAWILGRDWGRLKRQKVYKDTLDGVYLLLGREMQEAVVGHERFWQVAKVQMARVCTLEETAVNYVNWKMIETLPYYKQPAWRLDACPAEPVGLAVPPLWPAALPGGGERCGAAVCSGQPRPLLQPVLWFSARCPTSLASSLTH